MLPKEKGAPEIQDVPTYESALSVASNFPAFTSFSIWSAGTYSSLTKRPIPIRLARFDA